MQGNEAEQSVTVVQFAEIIIIISIIIVVVNIIINKAMNRINK